MVAVASGLSRAFTLQELSDGFGASQYMNFGVLCVGRDSFRQKRTIDTMIP
jgi:hypothetical protein